MTNKTSGNVGFAATILLLFFGGIASAQTSGIVQLLKNIHPGRDGSDPASFVTLNGIAYFRANDGAHGYELWRSDGTKSGTQLVIDLNSGPPNGFPDNVAVANGNLYFTAFNDWGYSGSKVWTSDGTAAGTGMLVDTYPGLRNGGPFGPPLPGNFTALDASRILFTALDPVAGLEPWITDRTKPGTKRIVDLHPGQQWSIPIGFTPLHNVAYFGADKSAVFFPDGTAVFNRELFRTDGTAEGTYQLKDIYPGPNPSIPTDFIRYRDRVFFRAADRMHGAEFWSTDGTEAGTTLLTDLNPGPAGSFPQYPIKVKFAADPTPVFVFFADDRTHGAELFRSDGTKDGTYLIKDINPTGNSAPLGLTYYKGHIYFSADDGKHGDELWTSDGTAGGTRLFADLNPGKLRSGPQSFSVAGDKLFFVSVVPDDANFTVRTQLWMTNGTARGTRMVYQEPGVSYGYSINNLIALGNKLLFTAPNGADAHGFSNDIELFSVSSD